MDCLKLPKLCLPQWEMRKGSPPSYGLLGWSETWWVTENVQGPSFTFFFLWRCLELSEKPLSVHLIDWLSTCSYAVVCSIADQRGYSGGGRRCNPRVRCHPRKRHNQVVFAHLSFLALSREVATAVKPSYCYFSWEVDFIWLDPGLNTLCCGKS